VKIARSETVSAVKKVIKDEKQYTFPADELGIYDTSLSNHDRMNFRTSFKMSTCISYYNLQTYSPRSSCRNTHAHFCPPAEGRPYASTIDLTLILSVKRGWGLRSTLTVHGAVFVSGDLRVSAPNICRVYAGRRKRDKWFIVCQTHALPTHIHVPVSSHRSPSEEIRNFF